jgi:hypothetical protein
VLSVFNKSQSTTIVDKEIMARAQKKEILRHAEFFHEIIQFSSEKLIDLTHETVCNIFLRMGLSAFIARIADLASSHVDDSPG